jgi:hypothetical protein
MIRSKGDRLICLAAIMYKWLSQCILVFGLLLFSFRWFCSFLGLCSFLLIICSFFIFRFKCSEQDLGHWIDWSFIKRGLLIVMCH